ncbi:phosphatidylinositol-specific phospholipase C1-like protein, partial [Gluconacetobacter sacchari]|uniref:phosphatidylinositol-specific phospholipase C1-like protein n=1 Tax=Gluconacetobacter sacchari TaxID=92759 RepID=UPI00223025FE
MPVRFPRRAGRAVGVGLAVLLAAWARPGAAGAEEGMRLDQIQVIGSHNSYHAGLAPSIAALLARRDPRSAQGLDYAHADLPTQFDHGIRQIELDIYADTAGGRFAHPKTARWLAG